MEKTTYMTSKIDNLQIFLKKKIKFRRLKINGQKINKSNKDQKKNRLKVFYGNIFKHQLFQG